ncbi:MAG TPA: protease inhibitor I42 family protein [Gammaproteobacteria bacterium]|nr:protease inhibitor I42 family protein [Gammaproteobacteria bacterium]
MILKRKLFKLIATLFLLNTTIFASEVRNTLIEKSDFYTENNLNIIITKDHPEFILKLKSNPTTGYSWFLREYSRNLIKPIKHRFQAATQKLIGASGYEWWTFSVQPVGFVVPQHTTIRMIYARPWQGADRATQVVFRVTTIP